MIQTLVVDDDPHILRLLARLLTPHGHQCTLADGVSAATRLLTENAFDLALVDMRMAGDTDGFDLLREIGRRHSATATVMLTAVEDPQMAATAYQLGADGYLLKPFRPSQLLITITNAMDRRQVEADNARHRHELTRVLAAEQQARERAVRAVQRARALARISDGLVATRDLARLHDEVAQALTSALGDGCAVIVEAGSLTPGGAPGSFALAGIGHRDPRIGEALQNAWARADLDALVRRAPPRCRHRSPCWRAAGRCAASPANRSAWTTSSSGWSSRGDTARATRSRMRKPSSWPRSPSGCPWPRTTPGCTPCPRNRSPSCITTRCTTR
jgi:DNA-binding response OmpR family regulator